MTENDKFVFSNCNRELVQNSISYQHCGKIKQHQQQHNKRRPCLKRRHWQLALPLRWNKDIRWSKLTKQLSYRTTLSCFAQLHLLPPQVAGKSSNLFISVEDTECPFGNSVFYIKKDAQGVLHYMHLYSSNSPPSQSHLLVDFSPRIPSQMTDGSLPSRLKSKIRFSRSVGSHTRSGNFLHPCSRRNVSAIIDQL